MGREKNVFQRSNGYENIDFLKNLFTYLMNQSGLHQIFMISRMTTLRLPGRMVDILWAQHQVQEGMESHFSTI